MNANEQNLSMDPTIIAKNAQIAELERKYAELMEGIEKANKVLDFLNHEIDKKSQELLSLLKKGRNEEDKLKLTENDSYIFFNELSKQANNSNSNQRSLV